MSGCWSYPLVGADSRTTYTRTHRLSLWPNFLTTQGLGSRVKQPEIQSQAEALLSFSNQPWNSHSITFCLLGASHYGWLIFYLFYGMNISKCMDTFKNQLNLPTSHNFLYSSHMENTLIPTQYHKSQLLWHQAQARVQGFTILGWCRWRWRCLDCGFWSKAPWQQFLSIWRHENQRDELSTTHTPNILQNCSSFPFRKMGGMLVHSYSEIQPDACCPFFDLDFVLTMGRLLYGPLLFPLSSLFCPLFWSVRAAFSQHCRHKKHSNL